MTEDTEDTEHPAPSRLSAMALLAGASLGLAAMWWLRQNLTQPPAPGAARPGSSPTPSPSAKSPPPNPSPADEASTSPAQTEAAPTTGQPASPATEAAADKAATVNASGAQATPDDLTRIEGIGPKLGQALVAYGIGTFAALASQSPEELREILATINSRYRVFNPETWPEQAALAAAGSFEELKELQKELKGGRRS